MVSGSLEKRAYTYNSLPFPAKKKKKTAKKKKLLITLLAIKHETTFICLHTNSDYKGR